MTDLGESSDATWNFEERTGAVCFCSAQCSADPSDPGDGKIAGKFNTVSDFDKILDPIADKMTQAARIACLPEHTAVPCRNIPRKRYPQKLFRGGKLCGHQQSITENCG